ncbi:MAG: FAD:protein FMN transferase [Spirochaetia bacterium]
MLVLLGCSEESTEPQREQRRLLGTTSIITIYDDSIPEDAFERYFSRVEEIQNRMSINESDYDDTEVLQINRNAGEQAVEVSSDTFHVIQQGKEWGRVTDGVFDISVTPLVRLWGIGTSSEQVPSEEAREEALSHIDFRDVELNESEQSVYLKDEGMGIDVGGIAKGFAVDEIVSMMSEDGIEGAIVDFGGDLYTIGTRPNGDPWRIGIQHPSGRRQELLAVITSSNESVVTSGPYERYFEGDDGERYHHIFDIETGAPARSGLVSATVIGPEALAADVLSTTIFVMGLEEGAALIESLPDYEAVFATEDGGVYATGDVADNLEIQADDFELRELDSTDSSR